MVALGDGLATASTHESANELVFHELGHSFSWLADEYWAGQVYAHEAINMTQETDLGLLKWKNWYGEFEIGLFPHEESPDWYRPHQACKMRYLGVPYCAVCIEGTIERIHNLTSPVLYYYPDENNITSSEFPIDFYLELIDPIPNTLKRSWELNGSLFTNNVDSISLHEENLVEGSNNLTVIIEDTTEMQRIDSHTTIHLSSVTWNIEYVTTGIENISSNSNKMVISLFPNPLKDYLNIEFKEMIEGDYKVEIVDLNGKTQAHQTINSVNSNPIFIGNLRQGIYVVKIYFNNGILSSRKIIINK